MILPQLVVTISEKLISKALEPFKVNAVIATGYGFGNTENWPPPRVGLDSHPEQLPRRDQLHVTLSELLY